MRILIVGSDANAYTLAKKISQLEQVDLVFVAPGNPQIKDFATSIDISSNFTDELLDFAKANEINLTVVVDEEALKNSIANVFFKAGLNIFAPSIEASRVVISKSSSKKTLYKLRVQTPKFGIFDRENMAVDYARKSKYPLIIKNDINVPNENPFICNTFSKAKLAIETLFEEFNKKIVIEEYIDAKTVSFYVISDGYTAFPIARVCSRKPKKIAVSPELKDETPELLNLAFSPDYYVSKELESRIMSRVVYPVIDEISKHSAPYAGILGIDLLLTANGFQVLEFNTFFKPLHLQASLPLINSNLFELSLAATNGSLSDDYNEVEIGDNIAISIEIEKKIDLPFIDSENLEVSYSKSGTTIISSCASTLTLAKAILVEFLQEASCDFPSWIKEINSLGEGKI